MTEDQNNQLKTWTEERDEITAILVPLRQEKATLLQECADLRDANTVVTLAIERKKGNIEMMEEYEPDDIRRQMIRAALVNHINTIDSSSMGRLFDAAACIMGIRVENSYEGECAIALENAAAEYMDMHPGVLEKTYGR